MDWIALLAVAAWLVPMLLVVLALRWDAVRRRQRKRN